MFSEGSVGCETTRHVLVVDDDQVSLETYAKALKIEGMRVSTATSVHDAKIQVQSNTFDFIISDLVLPDGDGIDLLRFARAQGSAVAFVVLTGFPTSRSLDEAERHGAIAYLTKPFWIDDLVELMKEHFTTGGQSVEPWERESVQAQAMAIIEPRFNEPCLRVATIARELNLSREHLSRVFRATHGKCPVVVIRERRLDAAAELLATSRMMVKEIAYASGYRRVDHFARDYQRRFGRLPSASRD